MPIDPKELQRHLDGYHAVTGNRTERFICPITLRPCETHELIDGHILNEALLHASRRTVIQYGKVDGYYGTKVEPALIRYLNSTRRDDRELIYASSNLKIVFRDGSTCEAFATTGRNARNAAKKFPLVDLKRDGEVYVSLFARTAKDDPRLDGPADLSHSASYMPSHWTASMLKAAYLTMFYLFGYMAVFEPYTQLLRQPLAAYFNDQASAGQAGDYFGYFGNAIKILGRATTMDELQQKYQRFEYDSINDRVVLMHATPGRIVFAATYLFTINDLTVTIAIPQSLGNPDPRIVLEYYDRMMQREPNLPQTHHHMRLVNGVWQFDTTPSAIAYDDEPHA
ncbi:hypothetical protein BH09PLA1_BH09PLA1_01500 [soil metagenome]